MWTYLANSLAWSGLGLIVGAGITEAGYDLFTIVRNISGRAHRDDT